MLNTIDVQVRRLRRRQIMGAITSGKRNGGFWAINTDPADFPVRATLNISTAFAHDLAMVDTRLATLKPDKRHQSTSTGRSARSPSPGGHPNEYAGICVGAG